MQAWWTVAVFCFAALVSYTDRLILGSLVDPLKKSLGIGDSAVSLLQGAAFVIVYVVAGLFVGRLADRRRRLTVLICGSAFWCIGTIASGLAPTFPELFLARVVVGIGEATLAPAAASIIADIFPPTKRGAALGCFMMGFVVGGPASIAIGGLMMSWANAGVFSGVPGVGTLEPWRAVLTLVGISGFVLPLLLLTLREPVRRETEQANLPFLATMRHLASYRRSLGPIYLALALLAVGDYGALTWIPSVLSRRFGLPPDQFGEALGSVLGIAGIVGCLIGGVASDRAARRLGTAGRLRLALAAAVVAAAAASLVCGSQMSLVLAGAGIWTVCSSIGSISGIAAIQNLVPNEYRGFGIAVLAFCNTLLGLGCGPTVVALLTENLYLGDVAVGQAVTTVALPAAAAAAILLLYSARNVATRPEASAELK